MKKLITATILIIAILGTSSVFLHVSMYSLSHAIANHLGQSNNKRETHISDQMTSGSPDQFENVNNNSKEQEVIDPDVPDPDKQCSSTCPINTSGVAG
jgi:cell division protein FtsL